MGLNVHQAAESRILVVGPGWVGDTIMAQTLFKVLKDLQPNAVIDVLAPPWAKQILDRMPEVRHALEMPVGHGRLSLIERYQLAVSLRGQYDHAIVLPNSYKSALIPYWACIPKRTGWRGEWRYGLLNDLRVLNPTQYPLMIERFMALAFQKGAAALKKDPYPQLKTDASNLNAMVKKWNLNTLQPILTLCPGAEFGPAKRWPADHFVNLALTYIERHWQVWIMGGEKDRDIATLMASQLPKESTHNLAGRTSMGDVIDLMSLSSAVVSNDSGLMHIAAALGKPMAVVYGSSSPKFTPPLSQHAQAVSLHLSCSPCFERECPLGHTACLKNLIPTLVEEALEQQLKEPLKNKAL